MQFTLFQSFKEIISDKEKSNMVYWIIIQIFVFLLVDSILHFFESNVEGRDISIYYYSATETLNGGIPYKDFSLEYPPFSLVFFIIPKLFVQNYSEYLFAFKIEIIIFNVIGTLLIINIFNLLEIEKKWLVYLIGFQTLILAFIGSITLYRYDIIPAVISLVSVFCFVKYIKEKEENFEFLAWIFLAFGVMTKLYPIFLAPLYIIAHFRINGSIKKIYKSILFLFFTIIVFSTPFLIYAFNDFTSFLTYHFNRGIQLESIYSSFLLPTKFFGNQITIDVRYGAYEVISSQSQILSQLSLVLLFVFLFIIYFIYFISTKNNFNVKELLLFCFLAISSFIIFNKVFSPQYLVWIYFLIPLVVFSINERKNKIIFIITTSVISLLTQLIYPYHYGGLISFHTTEILLLAFRNLLFLFIVLYMIIFLLKRNWNK